MVFKINKILQSAIFRDWSLNHWERISGERLHDVYIYKKKKKMKYLQIEMILWNFPQLI